MRSLLIAGMLTIAIAPAAYAQDHNTSTIEQIGLNHDATINQTAEHGASNNADVKQTGSNHSVMLTQYACCNVIVHAMIYQAGSDGFVEHHQRSGMYGSAESEVFQFGFGSRVVVDQRGTDSLLVSRIAEAGMDNDVSLTQAGHPGAARSSIYVRGVVNSVQVDQNVSRAGSTSYITVIGDQNDASISQSGFRFSNRTYNRFEGDGNLFQLGQYGEHGTNASSTHADGDDNHVNVLQNNNDIDTAFNFSKIEIHGHANMAGVDQGSAITRIGGPSGQSLFSAMKITGSGHSISVLQDGTSFSQSSVSSSGNGNVIAVTQ